VKAAAAPAAAGRFAGGGGWFGLIAAVIALAGQIALGAVVLRSPAGASDAARLDAVAVLCHVGGTTSGESKTLPHHPSGVPVSALAQAVAQAAGLLGPASASLRAPIIPARFILRPLSPRAPPAGARLAAQPRGPPTLA
jgi:hypothetical protein